MKRKIFKKLLMLLIFATTCLSAFPSTAICKDGKSEDSPLAQKVSTIGLSPFYKWWVDLYNEDRLVYALYATLVMAFLGITIGFGTDGVLRLIGFKTTKITHHE